MQPLTSELYRQVCAVLWEDWDPIGVNRFGVADEYDGYALELIAIVQNDATENKIVHYLGQIAHERMGLNHIDDNRDRMVAQKLIHLVRGSAPTSGTGDRS